MRRTSFASDLVLHFVDLAPQLPCGASMGHSFRAATVSQQLNNGVCSSSQTDSIRWAAAVQQRVWIGERSKLKYTTAGGLAAICSICSIFPAPKPPPAPVFTTQTRYSCTLLSICKYLSWSLTIVIHVWEYMPYNLDFFCSPLAWPAQHFSWSSATGASCIPRSRSHPQSVYLVECGLMLNKFWVFFVKCTVRQFFRIGGGSKED